MSSSFHSSYCNQNKSNFLLDIHDKHIPVVDLGFFCSILQTERPTFEKEATRNLQEENIELHQQVSLLSQWNDKHQRTITTLEQHVENMEEEKRQILVELMQMQSHEQVQRRERERKRKRREEKT